MAAKSLHSQNVWAGGMGNRRYTYKLRYILHRNDQNSSYINLVTVILLSGQPQ